MISVFILIYKTNSKVTKLTTRFSFRYLMRNRKQFTTLPVASLHTRNALQLLPRGHERSESAAARSSLLLIGTSIPISDAVPAGARTTNMQMRRMPSPGRDHAERPRMKPNATCANTAVCTCGSVTERAHSHIAASERTRCKSATQSVFITTASLSYPICADRLQGRIKMGTKEGERERCTETTNDSFRLI